MCYFWITIYTLVYMSEYHELCPGRFLTSPIAPASVLAIPQLHWRLARRARASHRSAGSVVPDTCSSPGSEATPAIDPTGEDSAVANEGDTGGFVYKDLSDTAW